MQTDRDPSTLTWGKVQRPDKACQWYFEGKPCTLLEWGMKAGQAFPECQKVRLNATGEEVSVWFDHATDRWPGLAYEVFEHHPGSA